MKHKSQGINESRRRLLGGAVGLGAAGASLSALGLQTAPHANKSADEPKPAAQSGYRETDHIRAYYRTAW